MRTRFLNTDCFTASQSPIETLSFLNLPPPHLPPSRLPKFTDDLLRFDRYFDVPLKTERLPIDAALSKFLSESIPQFIDVDFRDFGESPSPSGNIVASFSERDVGRADDKDVGRFDVILFETLELDAFLDNAQFSEKEIEKFSGIPEIDNIQDEKEPTVQYPNKIQESVYSVEDIISEYSLEHNSYVPEEDSYHGDQMLLQHNSFPILEVDEINLSIMTCHSTDDVLASVFESIESHPWTQENVLVDSEELLGSSGYDITKFLSDDSLSEQFPKPERAFPDIFLDTNLLCLVETPHVDGCSNFDISKPEADYLLPMNLVIFEEFQILDGESSQSFEGFLNRQMAHEPGACGQLFSEDMNLKSFNELVVSYELVLIDERFKSLPTPVLSDYNKTRSTSRVAGELLSGLKALPLSASDGIYLDWYILEEDKFSGKVYSLFQNMVEDVDSCDIDFDQETFKDGKVVSDFIFSVDVLSESGSEKYEEALNASFDSIHTLNIHLMGAGATSGNLPDNGCGKPGNSEQLTEKDAKRASLLFKSMSEFNDLDFFLNPQKGTAGENAGLTAMSSDPTATLPNISSGHSVEGCAMTGVKLQPWDTKVYNIKLSEDTLALMEKFEKSYLAILQNETELISFLPADNFELLRLPKQKLMECIKKKMARRTTSPLDEDVIAFATLCAIKQMAWYMCFYGIHAAHLYVNKLCQSLCIMKSKLNFLHSLVEDTLGKVDNEITKLHSSLSVIQGILQSNISPSSSKVLILADQVFWWSLKSLLMSMGLSWYELSNFGISADQSDAYKMDAQLISDCWLVSQENVSATFPFNKFNLIVEYGGSCGSSRVSSLSPELVGLPPLHFLKIEFDGSSAPKALCEGVDMPCITKKFMEGVFHSIPALDDNVNYQNLEALLNFVPIEDQLNKRSVKGGDKIGHCMPLPVAVEASEAQQRSDIVIIVNTQNFDKEMIVSRRSTYQKILAMEKDGAQVVERDSNLPVDLIISAAICLVWYDCKNIGRKAATLDEASSCLPSCIENIATNILTSLSFTFSGCFLVFEGDIGFLSTVMDSSAGLYAAAASLGMDFQLFCSYSSDLTDEIILHCIDYAAKLNRGLYPRMPDSETLAESFLTKFPSINPLTAHAILSSGGMLIEFLEWSQERRIQAVQNYCVPDESVALFSALCKYGEREDSKSIMTDCSSSVSSGPDSEKGHRNVGSEGKQKKYRKSPHNISKNMDDLLHVETMNQGTDDFMNHSGLSKPYNSWLSKGSKVFQDYKKHSSSLNDISDQNQEFDFTSLFSTQGPKQHESHISGGPQASNEANKAKQNLPLKDNIWGYNQGENMALLDSLDWQNINNSEIQHKEVEGEIIDLTDSPMSAEDFSSFGNSIPFSSLLPEIEEDSTRKPKIARRLSFGRGSHSVLPYVSEINTSSDILHSVKHPRESFQGTNANPDTGYKHKLPLSNQENLMQDVFAQGSAACKGSILRNDASTHKATPLSKAILSAHPQPGSPWTIEFLNKVREKSRFRLQNLPSDTSASPFKISGNIARGPKRKSPSMLDFFRYQGGSTPRKILEQRKQKGYPQSASSSKNEKASSSLEQTWTPSDKRARQTLSFAVNESGGQTKLVWSEGGAHGLSKKLRKQ